MNVYQRKETEYQPYPMTVNSQPEPPSQSVVYAPPEWQHDNEQFFITRMLRNCLLKFCVFRVEN